MIKTYSQKMEGSSRLSEHFRVREFAQAGCDEVKIDEELVERLESLYARLGCSKIIITSGYRSDGSGSQHCRGKAADVNCWHMDGGKEVRYQGKEILLAAEDAGFRGIGWIPGSAASRAAVHLDTRENKYFFDEADGNRSIGESWYPFFGLAKPNAPDGNPYAEPAALLQNGSRGDGVRWVQWQLNKVCGADCGEIDGIFGSGTAAAVRIVQKAAKIAVDGIVGKDTLAALKLPIPGAGTQKCPYSEPSIHVLRGSAGEGVKWVQWQLGRLGYAPGSIDGIFGAATDKAVRAFQRDAGLAVDGIVGTNTRRALEV